MRSENISSSAMYSLSVDKLSKMFRVQFRVTFYSFIYELSQVDMLQKWFTSESLLQLK